MKTTAKRLQVDAVQPARNPLLQAARAISSGGLVVFPTRGLYGLGVDAFNVEAVHKVFRTKGRSPDNPVLILIRHRDDLGDLVTAVPDSAARLMENIWPGSLTLVLTASRAVPTALTAGSGKIGIRLPAHPVARSLVEAVGRPITGTSANVSGRPGCSTIENLDAQVAGAADLILDAGRLAGGAGSTVVDVTRGKPVILRSGAVSDDTIRKALVPD
ncbi:MAG: threonylcarbamoyl-AMP synthase [Desulfobacterales bacterium]|nr:threonylcarbamoyl-AMP synthase [Desulfobacterales bacterium]